MNRKGRIQYLWLEDSSGGDKDVRAQAEKQNIYLVLIGHSV